MNDYTPNSNKYKAEQAAKEARIDKKDIIKPITGGVKVRKKSELLKLADIFVPSDRKNLGEYIMTDVVVPLIKKGISEVVDIWLWGESRRKTVNGNQTYTSYGSFYDYRNSNNRPSDSVGRPNYTDKDIVLNSRGDAESVIDQLNAVIEQYRAASVADLYDILGQSCNYTDNDYGWTDLRDASVERAYGGGYRLVLPRARSLKG